MVVGACRITLALPGNDSLKGKRSVVRPILDRMRARFNVAAAEVATQDHLGYATIGFAVVSNERAHAQSMIDTIASFVSQSGRAVVTSRDSELVSIGTFGER